MGTRRGARGALLALLALLAAMPLAACGGNSGSGNDKVTIGLSYIPNIQFAPFYVALEKGFYAAEGLDVKLNHHAAGADLFGAIVAGQEDVVFAGGDEVLQARGKGPELVYVAQVFNAYPVALIVPANSDIQTAADLAGRTVGVPGEYGANFIALLALLKGAGLTRQDVNVQSIGFTQVSALLNGQVDAVMGYVNNEPIQLSKAGMATRTITIGDAQPLVSNGLVALRGELDKQPERVKKIIAATLKGVQYTIDNPEEAVRLSAKYVPDLTGAQQQADALAVLQATLPLWRTDGPPSVGDPAAWQSMANFLLAEGMLAAPLDVSAVYDPAYLPKP